MKLNILILLVLLSVSAYCQVARLHNVIREAPVGDDSNSEFLDEAPQINPTQLIVEKNGEPWTADTVEEAPASADVHNKNNHCGRREGWVGLVSPLEYQWKDKVAYKALHAKQVFVELTNESITFYANHNVNSVIQTLLLRDVAMPVLPEEWKKYGCLQLKYANKELDKEWYKRDAIQVFEDHLDHDAIVSFCVGNLEGILHWAKDIWEYPRCSVYVEGENEGVIGRNGMEVNQGWNFNGIGGSSNGFKVRIDSQKDQLTQYQLAIAAQRRALVTSINDSQTHDKETEINHRYDEEITRINEESNSETQQIYKVSTQIEDDINVGIKKQTEERRHIDEEKHDMENELDKMREEKDCLQQLLRQRQQSEVAASETMIREEQLTKEEKILQSTRDAMLKEQQAEGDKAKALHFVNMNEIKNEMTKVNESMINDALSANQQIYDKPYCNSNGQDKAAFITKTCEKITTVTQTAKTAQDVSQCTSEAHFCDTCCALFIGSAQVGDRSRCAADCNSSLTSSDVVAGGVTGEVNLTPSVVANNQAAIEGIQAEEQNTPTDADRKKFLRF